MTRTTLTAAAFLMGAAVLASRVLGYVRDAYIAYAFGAGPATDAYTAAFTLPDFLNYALAGGALSITFVPIYTGYLVRGQRAEGERVFQVVTTTMGLAMSAGVVVMELAAPWVVPRLVPAFDASQLALSIRMTRILLPAQVFFYVGGIVQATLYARQTFLAGAAAPLIYNAGILAGGVVLGRWLGVESLAWGAVAGAVVGPFLMPVLAARRAGAAEDAAAAAGAPPPWRPRIELSNAGFRQWLALTVPLMIGFSLTTADEWIMRWFASGVSGAIFRINLARRLLLVPVAVLAQAAGQAALPFLARLHAEGKGEELAARTREALGGVWIATALAAGWLAALAHPAVDLLYRRGGFDIADARTTGTILVVFAAAVPFWGAQAILSRAFYARQETWTPMLAGTIVTLASVPLFWAGWRAFGEPGLASASTLGMAGHVAALTLLLRTRLPGVVTVPLAGRAFRGLVLAALAGAAAWGAAYGASFLAPPGHARSLWQLGAGSAAFLPVAIAGARVLGISEVAALITRLGARLSRRTAPA